VERLGLALALILAVGLSATAHAQAPKVRRTRPRLFFRAKAWGGPSVEKVRSWMKRPEYQAQANDLGKPLVGRGLRYLLLDDVDAGKQVVEALKKLEPPARQPKASPSYTGIDTTKMAALYDWFHDHPDFKDHRAGAVATFEWWGDYYKRYLRLDGVTPFYCRNSGALAGLTAVGLALHGDSPRAQAYLEHAQKYLKESMGTIRRMEDGATSGATYGLFHQFTDLGHVAAMWRSATDWDAAQWIKEQQGNWLERQMLYQVWITYPNGFIFKDGDVWGGNYRDRYDARMQIDSITGMYRSGYGRSHALAMRKRWGRQTYYGNYVWMFYIFNDPEIQPKPLDGLGRAEVFSPKLHGVVCWRSAWKPDATVVHFKCGDNVDHHGTYDTGKFMIFKHGPLAIKNGHYRGYKSSKHWYYKSPWSANVVIFDSPQKHGYQPFVDFDGAVSWTAWKARRDKYKHPPTGVLRKTEANDRYARAVGDLSGSTWPTGSTWIRELVFLGYKYVIVLDRVRPGKDVKTRWLLHSINVPKIDAAQRLAVIDNGKGRLFCKSLLPEGAKMVQVGGPEKAFVHKTRSGKGLSWPLYKARKAGTRLGAGRLDVVPADDAAPCVYLHVLYPTDTGTAAMPNCSVEQKGDAYTVKVADLSHTFKLSK